MFGIPLVWNFCPTQPSKPSQAHELCSGVIEVSWTPGQTALRDPFQSWNSEERVSNKRGVSPHWTNMKGKTMNLNWATCTKKGAERSPPDLKTFSIRTVDKQEQKTLTIVKVSPNLRENQKKKHSEDKKHDSRLRFFSRKFIHFWTKIVNCFVKNTICFPKSKNSQTKRHKPFLQASSSDKLRCSSSRRRNSSWT